MQPSARQISTCSNCGGVLEETPSGGLGCMSCLLRAGIGSEEEVAQDSNPNALENGGRFGVYEIDCHADGSLCELGRGAMGVTYRATDTSLQRKVALKIIKIDIAERSADARERFMREARAAASLRHENIATIHQFGMRLETGQYFYAMELIEGETLEERVRRAGPLDARTTIKIAQQVTSALAAAEKCGLVHRDLKPANLMLVSSDGETAEADRVSLGTATQRRDYNVAHAPVAASLRRGAHQKHEKLLVKIIDFGLAKAIHTEIDPKSLTHDRFVGTPAFASPEQFEHAALDVRSDIYSLGETLWFALTGKTPFAGRSVEEIHRAQQANVLPIEQLKAAHVPSRLRSLLGSMLAFEPASRPGTGELAARLQRCSPEAGSARRTRVALAVAALVILGMSALFVFHPSRIRNSPLNPEKSIAVLPFENRSEDKANAYFADGIQDEILTRLSKIADLKVISRTSTQQYQSKPANLREIAKQLGVANILEGSVQKVADQVRVNVQLVNAQTDSHLWADIYDRKVTDILGVESEIAKAIAASLQAKLTGAEQQAIEQKPTNNREAYDAYLHGLSYALRSGYTESDTLDAIKYFSQAVELDPKFALAWTWLAHKSALGYFNNVGTNVPGLRETAKRAAEKVAELEPNRGEAYLAKGHYQYYCDRDYGSAIASFEKARQLLPSNSDILQALGHVSRRKNEWQLSLKYFQQAIDIDPRNISILSAQAGAYWELRQYSAALKVYDRILEISPDNLGALASKAGICQAKGDLHAAATLISRIHLDSSSELFWVQIHQWMYERRYAEAINGLKNAIAKPDRPLTDWQRIYYLHTLALLQQFSGDMARARETWQQVKTDAEKLLATKGQGFGLWVLAEAYAALGDKTKALATLEHAAAVPRGDPLRAAFFAEIRAEIAVLAGEKELALDQLAISAQQPGGVTYGDLKLHPTWDPLRGDPRFEKIVASLVPKER